MNYKLPVNLFDFVLVTLLIMGVFRGRKNGMSGELMSLLKWLTVVVVCSALYRVVGRWIRDVSVFSLLASYVIAYMACALVVLSGFALVRHSLGGKLVGSDVFGRSEYYLGMASGLVRFACLIIVGLALLNARFFSQAEVRAMEAYQNDVYGSNFFPGLQSLQSTVFERSFLGPQIKENLSFLLIEPTQPDNSKYQQRELTFP
jgi:uncharacterized membrane protein required for colicin V production